MVAGGSEYLEAPQPAPDEPPASGRPELKPRRLLLSLAVGLSCFVAAGALPLPEGLPVYPARAAALVTGFVVSAWVTGAVAMGAASLVPLCALPLLGVLPIGKAAASYADPIIWMFFGGMILAAGIERWGLHRRLALLVLAHAGARPSRLVLGVMLTTAFLSMWINNTATSLLVLPIALALISTLKSAEALDARSHDNFSFAMLTGLAYAASMGGMGTPVGTAPNAVFFANYKPFVDAGAPPLTFAQWMVFGVPLVIITVPLTWLILTKVVAPMRGAAPEAHDVLLRAAHTQAPLSQAEWRMGGLFAAAALLWLFRSDIDLGGLVVPGWWRLLPVSAPEHLGDGSVAALIAVLALILPSGVQRGTTLVSWPMVQRLPWDVLFLMGGGIAMARALAATGLAQGIGNALQPLLGTLPPFLVVLVVCVSLTFLSEIASNTAVAALFVPILIGVAVALEVDPRLLMLPAALAASNGYMLPVATPPNAIVCATGQVALPRMARAGFLVNLMAAVVVALVVWTIAIPALGIQKRGLPDWAAAALK